MTIAQLAERMAAGSLTAAALLESVLACLEATEPAVHAYAAVDADRARADAARLDAERADGRTRGPLHGIPVAVKDVVWTRQLPTRAGSRALAGFRAPADATVVRKLADAGAVLVGKTVTHEFAYGQNVPPTRCPWDTSCYPGGSSAGSGVAVAVGSALAAIGTDTGGSVRNPAAVNGIVGLKPTNGRVSRYGVIPVSESLDVVGPLTRTVEDCALVLGAIAGRDERDATTLLEPVPDYREHLRGELGRVRVGVDRASLERAAIHADVRAAFDTALGVLADLGADVVDVRIPELEHALASGLALAFAETAAWHRELLRTNARDYDPATRVMVEVGFLLTATEIVLAQRMRTAIQGAVRRVFEECRLDCVAAPTLPRTTLPVDELEVDLTRAGGIDELAGAVRVLVGANVVGAPAVSVPCGSAHGLPIGLQLMGRPLGEADLLRIAYAYEQATPWHLQRPPLLATA